VLLSADLRNRQSTVEELSDYAHLKLLLSVAVAANESSIMGAMQSTVDAVCEYTGWPVGHGYLLDRGTRGQFVSTTVWNRNVQPEFDPFRAVTEKTRLALTEGLPGLVVAAGKPVRLMNLADPHVFPRSKSAVVVGLKFGFGFPVVIGNEILAVLEFFSTSEFQISDDFEKLMSRIGTLLGRAFERQATAEVLRQSEEKYRALADTASDASLYPGQRLGRDQGALH
jgi:GAF domain-containing protein